MKRIFQFAAFLGLALLVSCGNPGGEGQSDEGLDQDQLKGLEHIVKTDEMRELFATMTPYQQFVAVAHIHLAEEYQMPMQSPEDLVAAVRNVMLLEKRSVKSPSKDIEIYRGENDSVFRTSFRMSNGRETWLGVYIVPAENEVMAVRDGGMKFYRIDPENQSFNPVNASDRFQFSPYSFFSQDTPEGLLRQVSFPIYALEHRLVMMVDLEQQDLSQEVAKKLATYQRSNEHEIIWNGQDHYVLDVPTVVAELSDTQMAYALVLGKCLNISQDEAKQLLSGMQVRVKSWGKFIPISHVTLQGSKEIRNNSLYLSSLETPETDNTHYDLIVKYLPASSQPLFAVSNYTWEGGSGGENLHNQHWVYIYDTGSNTLREVPANSLPKLQASDIFYLTNMSAELKKEAEELLTFGWNFDVDDTGEKAIIICTLGAEEPLSVDLLQYAKTPFGYVASFNGSKFVYDKDATQAKMEEAIEHFRALTNPYAQ